MERKNLLLFPAGTEIALEIVNALKFSKFVKLYGGTSAKDHSEFVYSNLIEGFPYVDEPGFLEFLNDVIHRYKIDCVYPAHDSVCLYFSEHAAEIDAQVIIADYKTTSICRSKKETYKYFEKEKFLPKTYESLEEIREYPVFVKPDAGQGSNGARKVSSERELKETLAKDDTLVICEYLPGMEYTVDCFTDRHGRLRIAKLRDRERIRAGISVRSCGQPMDDAVIKIADTLNEGLCFRGAWFFQVKKNKSREYRLMEVSPRIPGAMGLSRNMGINFPMLTLFDFWGYDVEILDNGYHIRLDRAFYSAYKIDYEYSHVYVDFDDTLIIRDKVNTDLIKFLYQAVNQGKKLHLLSKHAGNIYENLKKYRIPESLFDEIVVIPVSEEKRDYITQMPAVFIDDSFAERSSVQLARNIPVFDVDMVESLIDWRI